MNQLNSFKQMVARLSRKREQFFNSEEIQQIPGLDRQRPTQDQVDKFSQDTMAKKFAGKSNQKSLFDVRYDDNIKKRKRYEVPFEILNPKFKMPAVPAKKSKLSSNSSGGSSDDSGNNIDYVLHEKRNSIFQPTRMGNQSAPDVTMNLTTTSSKFVPPFNSTSVSEDANRKNSSDPGISRQQFQPLLKNRFRIGSQPQDEIDLEKYFNSSSAPVRKNWQPTIQNIPPVQRNSQQYHPNVHHTQQSQRRSQPTNFSSSSTSSDDKHETQRPSVSQSRQQAHYNTQNKYVPPIDRHSQHRSQPNFSHGQNEIEFQRYSQQQSQRNFQNSSNELNVPPQNRNQSSNSQNVPPNLQIPQNRGKKIFLIKSQNFKAIRSNRFKEVIIIFQVSRMYEIHSIEVSQILHFQELLQTAKMCNQIIAIRQMSDSFNEIHSDEIFHQVFHFLRLRHTGRISIKAIIVLLLEMHLQHQKTW